MQPRKSGASACPSVSPSARTFGATVSSHLGGADELPKLDEAETNDPRKVIGREAGQQTRRLVVDVS